MEENIKDKRGFYTYGNIWQENNDLWRFEGFINFKGVLLRNWKIELLSKSDIEHIEVTINSAFNDINIPPHTHI